MLSLLVLIIASFLSLINTQTILNPLYSSDYTLTLTNSPYIVNTYVTFSSTAHIHIENGVQVIFIGNKFITVFGSLNCGCNTTTINNNIKGLSNPTQYIHIVGNESQPMSTGIFINQANSINPPKIQFCNTLFENIQNGINTRSNQYAPYTVHNCEFRSLNNAIHHSTNIINFIHNSYFHDSNSIQSGGGVIYDHCLFHLLGKFSYNTEKAVNIAITNSEIYGDSSKVCININSVANDAFYAIHNNIISGCKDAIEIWSGISIRNNTIRNCTRYGIHIINKDISDHQSFDIAYNSFTNNGEIDIFLDNVVAVNVINNKFMNNMASIYAQNCDSVSVENNVFTDLQLQPASQAVTNQYNDIITAQNCKTMDILHNKFENNRHKLGVFYGENNSLHINISYNVFMDNSMQYLLKMNEALYCDISHNNIKQNDIFNGYLMHLLTCDDVTLAYNMIEHNKHIETKNEFDFIYIQNANRLQILYNSFTTNNATYSSNLLSIKQPNILNIKHNIFDTNSINNILYLTYSKYFHTHTLSYIQYNDFIQKQNKNINTYIHINSDTFTQNNSNYINWNNFYNQSNVEHLISSNNININADSNYFDGLTTYTQIRTKMNDQCNHGFINISHVNQHTFHITDLLDMLIVYQCSWNLLTCNTISNYKCDTDTYSPTSSPTKSTPFIIIAQPPTYETYQNNTALGNKTILTTSSVPTVTVIMHGEENNFSILIIASSIGMAFLCLVSCEILWCVRKNTRFDNHDINDKEVNVQMRRHHLSYSVPMQIEQKEFEEHKMSSLNTKTFPNKQFSESVLTLISMELETKEEEMILVPDDDGDVEIEGDIPPIIPMMRYDVKEDTMTSLGCGEDFNEELYGIELQDDEFIIGSLPKKTDDGFAEGEHVEFVVRDSIDELNEIPTVGV